MDGCGLDRRLCVAIGARRLAIPEAVDLFSGRAAEAARKRGREGVLGAGDLSRGGINMTPEIARAAQHPEVSAYLDRLEKLAGREVEP